jgi:hypothetical protein
LDLFSLLVFTFLMELIDQAGHLLCHFIPRPAGLSGQQDGIVDLLQPCAVLDGCAELGEGDEVIDRASSELHFFARLPHYM